MNFIRRITRRMRCQLSEISGGGISKSFKFALAGAGGALLGALLGEVVLDLTRAPASAQPAPPARTVCLVMDTSNSMEGSKLAEVKNAAKLFVDSDDQSAARVGLVAFSHSVERVVAPTSAHPRLVHTLDTLRAGGSTAMHLGLQSAQATLADQPGSRYVLLFTDGVPDSRSAALTAAEELRRGGACLLAIGTDDADMRFLTKLTANPRHTIRASAGQYAHAFEQAETLILRASLLDEAVTRDSLMAVLRIGGWTAAVAAGIGVVLILCQNGYLNRVLHTGLLLGGTWSLLAGCLAGAGGQIVFLLVRTEAAGGFILSILLGGSLGGVLAMLLMSTDMRVVLRVVTAGVFLGLFAATRFHGLLPTATPFQQSAVVPTWILIGGLLARTASLGRVARARGNATRIGMVAGFLSVGAFVYIDATTGGATPWLNDEVTRMIGWSALGAGLGWCMAWFIPNLNPGHAVVSGVVGGLIGAGAYLALDAAMGGLAGRLCGAAVLGFSIGLMVVLAERFRRDAWLEVTLDSGGKRIVNLGPEAVSVGDNGATVVVPASADVHDDLRYLVRDSRIVCEDKASGLCREVRPGHQCRIGEATVTVCGDARRLRTSQREQSSHDHS